jgi:hypothetical protein
MPGVLGVMKVDFQSWLQAWENRTHRFNGSAEISTPGGNPAAA